MQSPSTNRRGHIWYTFCHTMAHIELSSCVRKVFVAAGLTVGPAACVKLTRTGAATPQAGMVIGLDAIAAVVPGGGLY